jgi:D-alanyl-D-alanine carboxypeptidase/D-alanyl-D-alanine-endopeptidase (penicillin-binding protein 4)
VRGWGAALAIAALAACAPKTAGPVTPPAGAVANLSPHEQLRRDLGAIFGDAAIDHGWWSVNIQSLQHKETLFSSNSFRMLTPASNQKLLTTAAAAERLGWDFRYTTRIYATGSIDANGGVNGDLIVVSDGDPTINPRHPERWGAFDDWGRQLAARGIRQVNGYLIGDDNVFEEPGWGLGWSWDDIVFGYGAAVGALQYNENQVELMIGPGLEAGARAIISVSPSGSGLIVDHQVTTAATGEPSRVTLMRPPNSVLLTVSGQVAIGSSPIIEHAAVDNPTQVYLNTMRTAFARHGVHIERTPLDIDDVRMRPDMSNATLLIEEQSPPLADIVDVALKWSRNIYADTLLLSMSPEGLPKSWAGGLAAAQETLTAWGVPAESYLARDGSGLSRYDYLSPDAVTALLTYLWSDQKHIEKFRAALPVFGVSGNVANRLKDTPASGRVWAKTGSMSQVRSLSGYLMTLDEEPLAFSILVNGFRVPSREIDAAIDRALLRLIEFKHTSHFP